jgi:hypothetical protein
LLGLSWGHFGIAFLRQRCGERRPKKHFLWHFGCLLVAASTQSVSCFSLKPLRSTLSWPLSTCMPSNHLWQVPWTELGPLWTGQRCPHFSRRSHKKPTHVSVFCDSFDSICLVEWSTAKLLLHRLCPFKTFIHPSRLWLSLLYH